MSFCCYLFKSTPKYFIPRTLFGHLLLYESSTMDYRKRRSPRREYIRKMDSYPSPKRRNRSRSPSNSARHHRISPYTRKSLRNSPKLRNSDRTISSSQSDSRLKFNKENDSLSRRRSRSCDRKLRKSNGDVRKPNYTGAENPGYLEKVRTSPSRIIVVRIEDKSGKVQNLGVNDDRSRSTNDINTTTERRSTINDTKVDADGGDPVRRVFLKNVKKNSIEAAQSNYTDRKNVYERQSTSAERNSMSRNNSHQRGSRRRVISYEVSDTQGKEQRRGFKSDKSDDCDRLERDRKSYEKYSRQTDRPYNHDRRSNSSHKRDGSRDRRYFGKDDEKKSRRHSKDKRGGRSEHRYSNHKEEFDEHSTNEEQSDATHNSEYKNEEKDDYYTADNVLVNDMIPPFMPLRPFFARPPLVPLPVRPRLLLPPPAFMRPLFPPRMPMPRPMFGLRPYPPVPPTF